MTADGYGLDTVTEAELTEFGEWLVRTRRLTPRPVSDYKSRVRRVARGVDMTTLTVNAQASLETAVRAFLAFRNEGAGRAPGHLASTARAGRKVEYGARAVMDAIDDRGAFRE